MSETPSVVSSEALVHAEAVRRAKSRLATEAMIAYGTASLPREQINAKRLIHEHENALELAANFLERIARTQSV